MPQRTQRSFVKAALLLLVGIAALWGLFQLIHQQTERMDQAVSDVSDLRDPSPFRVALSGHLDKIRLSALAYVRSPDGALSEQAVQSEAEFENSLHEFQKQNPRLFPAHSGEEILTSFAFLKSAVADTIKLSGDRADRRAAREKNFEGALFLISHRLRPLIHPSATDRRDALLGIENQLRTWQQSLQQAWPLATDAQQAIASENENKGETLVALYEDQPGLLSAERRVIKSLQGLWFANNDLARQDFVLGTVMSQQMDQLNSSYKRVHDTLTRTLPLLKPEELEMKKAAILRAMRLHLLFAGALALTGVAVLLGLLIGVWRLTKGVTGISAAPRKKSPAAPAEPEPVTLTMDLKGRIVSWSPAAQTLYGYDGIEMNGQSIALLFASETEIGRLYTQIKSSPHLSFETQHRAKSGVIFPARLNFRPMTAGKERTIGLICHRR